jgi:hypothetical protein
MQRGIGTSGSTFRPKFRTSFGHGKIHQLSLGSNRQSPRNLWTFGPCINERTISCSLFKPWPCLSSQNDAMEPKRVSHCELTLNSTNIQKKSLPTYITMPVVTPVQLFRNEHYGIIIESGSRCSFRISANLSKTPHHMTCVTPSGPAEFDPFENHYLP